MKLADWSMDMDRGIVFCQGEETHISPLAVEVLRDLIDADGEVVPIETLIEKHWRAEITKPNAVHKVVNELRRAFNDNPKQARFIETVPKRGYRWIVAPGGGGVLDRLAADGGSSGHRSVSLFLGSGLLVLFSAVVGWWFLGGDFQDGSLAERPADDGFPPRLETSEVLPSVFVPGLTPERGMTKYPEAQAHYLVGNEFYNSDPERAIDALKSAVTLDPDFTLAWITLSYAYGSRSRDPALTEAALVDMGNAAARAVTLDPEFWQSHDALGWYLMSRRDFISADAAFRKVVELSAQQGVAPHPSFTQYLWQLGRNEERLQLIRSVRHIDPFYPQARSLYFLGRREEAIADLNRARGVKTTIGGNRWWEALEQSLAIERGDPKELDRLIFSGTGLQGLWGTTAFTDRVWQILDDDPPLGRMIYAHLAIYASVHGETELALQLLRREFLRDGFGGQFLVWHPLLASVRQTQGFNAFLEEFGVVELFRRTGKWNDYCSPAGDNSFICR